MGEDIENAEMINKPEPVKRTGFTSSSSISIIQKSSLKNIVKKSSDLISNKFSNLKSSVKSLTLGEEDEKEEVDGGEHKKEGGAGQFNEHQPPKNKERKPSASPLSKLAAIASNKQMGSLSSSINSETRNNKGKELVETIASKLRALSDIWIAIVLNSLVLALYVTAGSSTGFTIRVLGYFLSRIAPVLIQSMMIVCSIYTARGIKIATGVFLGYLMSKPTGYSLAASAFAHASLWDKLTFPSFLSYKSKCKRFLTRLVYLWIFQSALVVLSLFASTGYTFKANRYDSGALSCVVYGQDGTPYDRGFPNVHVPMGVGEYVFGNSLGDLRSEMSVDYTTHVFPPQLTDTCNDGTTIVGKGFITNLLSSCKCANSMGKAHLMQAGLNDSDADAIIPRLAQVQNLEALISTINMGDDGESMVIKTIVLGTTACGGLNGTSPPVPVCKTSFWGHQKASVLAMYMTDGTPASIAIEDVQIREVYGPGNITWVKFALEKIMGGQASTILLPQITPGAVNSLLWWTTTNTQFVSASFLEPGLETTFAILMRSAFMRSFSARSSLCTQNVEDLNTIILYISDPNSLLLGLIFCISQLVINLLCLIACIPWFISSYPIGPAIRIATDQTYFTLMLISTPMTSGILSECISGVNMGNSSEAWPRLDITLRVGESISTKDDPERGSIALDRPKMITNFVISKLYT